MQSVPAGPIAASAAAPLAPLEEVNVDIDPGWYPGQVEAATPAGAEEPASPSYVNSVNVPTVLTKLQKWGDYQSVGTPVWPTRFIPMKTPLSKDLLEHWSLPEQPKHRLTVAELLETHEAQNKHIGLILDLSNHECLYTDDIPANVEYQHIRLVAKELPPQDFVDEVVTAANKFWRRHPQDYIAVHCAYGFNRTGFVLCSYLIEECGLSVEDALESFAHSRPPGVKHEQFRRELHRRYDHTCRHNGLGSPPDDNSSFGCSPNSRANAELLHLGMSRLAMRRMHSSQLTPQAMGRSASTVSVPVLAQMHRSVSAASGLEAMEAQVANMVSPGEGPLVNGSGIGGGGVSALTEKNLTQKNLNSHNRCGSTDETADSSGAPRQESGRASGGSGSSKDGSNQEGLIGFMNN